MSNVRTRSCRLVACTLVAALVASLVPHRAAHAETADHGAPAVAVAAQSGDCPDGGIGGCSSVSITILGTTFWCEACDCMWLVEGSDGNTRIVRDHWNDCGVS